MLTPRDRFGITVVFAGLIMLLVWACADSGTGGSTPTSDATSDGTTGGGGDADADTDVDVDADSDADADSSTTPSDASSDTSKPTPNDPDADASFRAHYGKKPFRNSASARQGPRLLPPAAQPGRSQLAQ